MNYDRICRADFIYNRMEKLKKGTEDKKQCFAILTLRGCQYGRKEEKSVGAANLLASSRPGCRFFIHGVFSYELFGQTFWITTTHGDW